jgi:ribosomal protein S18 acetylase RimI-like enzyme
VAVRLRPLSDDEVPEFIAGLREEYVRGLMEDARLSQREAEEKAASDHTALFPGGKAQPDQRMYVIERETGEPVGHMFWAERSAPGSEPRAFLYLIAISEPFRGRGHGREAMQLLEDEVRAAGLPGVDLNVWGRNDVARSLYSKIGYEERAVFMSKDLA